LWSRMLAHSAGDQLLLHADRMWADLQHQQAWRQD
jgi:hypothetical protein